MRTLALALACGARRARATRGREAAALTEEGEHGRRALPLQPEGHRCRLGLFERHLPRRANRVPSRDCHPELIVVHLRTHSTVGAQTQPSENSRLQGVVVTSGMKSARGWMARIAARSSAIADIGLHGRGIFEPCRT